MVVRPKLLQQLYNPSSCPILPKPDLWKIDVLFVVGGRGGQAAAENIHRECRSKKVGRAGGSALG